jgi:hypothetical protein
MGSIAAGYNLFKSHWSNQWLAHRVNFRLPFGIPSGNLPLHLERAFIPGPAVSIPVTRQRGDRLRTRASAFVCVQRPTHLFRERMTRYSETDQLNGILVRPER